MTSKADDYLSSTRERFIQQYGENYTETFLWAQEHDLADLLGLIYHTFGFENHLIDPVGIIRDFYAPCGIEIIESWLDNPIAKAIHKLVKTFENSPSVKAQTSIFPTQKNVYATERMIGPFSKKKYLWSMSLNQPFSFEGDYQRHYCLNMMHLFLYVHGLMRMNVHGYQDDYVLQAAGYLRIDTHEHDRIAFIDNLFSVIHQQVQGGYSGFQNFNFIVEVAVQELLNNASLKLTPGSRKANFLNNLRQVARSTHKKYVKRGDVDADKAISPFVPIGELTTEQPVRESEAGIRFQELCDQLSFQDLVDFDEDSAPVLAIDIEEPDEKTGPLTKAEALLKSRSIFFERTEQSHRLPWSWDTILPHEEGVLIEWLNERVHSRDTVQALAGALAWIALHFGRSLEMVMHLPVGDEPQDEWTLAKDFTSLKRLPIRRHSAWRPDSSNQDWVAPLGQDISVPLPIHIQQALKSAVTSTEVKQLSQLWAAYSDATLEGWFNQYRPASLDRVRSSMFANHFGQLVFNQTNDPNLARAVSSYPNSAQPAAYGYGCWDIQEIEKGLPFSRQVFQRPGVSVLGSMMLPVEDKLIDMVERQTLFIEQCDDPVDFHNCLAVYTVKALYAATGARALKDPFETIKHFYLADARDEVSFVFINDKHDGNHIGRVVPLCPSVVTILARYRTHLIELASLLTADHAELAIRIKGLLDGSTTNLPLFFLLDHNLQWHSVGQRSLLPNAWEDWPLPTNVLRHRFAQTLTQKGLPSDVLEAWMGHGERGIDAYGDYSPRCWQDDAAYFMGMIETIFTELPFKVISDKSLKLTSHQSEVPSDRRFGLLERKRKRQAKQRLTKKITLGRINECLQGRTWQDVSEDEFQALVSSLSSSSQGAMPVANVLRMMSILLAELNKVNSPYKDLLKKRYVSFEQDRTRLTNHAVNALTIFPKLVAWADHCKKTNYESNLSIENASQLAVILFCIERQISYRQLLEDIYQGRNFQLAQYKSAVYLGYSEVLDVEDLNAPRQWHRLSYKAASFFNRAYGKTHQLDLRASIQHPELIQCASILNVKGSFKSLLFHLCKIIEQVNLITMPGMVAASLSQQLPPTSVSWQDRLRIQHKKHSCLPNEQDDHSTSEGWQSIVPNDGQWRLQSTSVLKTHAAEFQKAIYEELKTYKKSSAKTVAKNVTDTCKNHSYKVSDAVLSVGYWIAHLVENGQYTGGKKPVLLANNTISTYFSTVMPVFVQLAHNVNIFALETDELTELFDRMISQRSEQGSKVEFLGKRLYYYHRWLLKQGAATVDWSDIDIKADGRTVSSGILGEADYLGCLKQIGHLYPDRDQAAILRFVLLLGFRFGLRLQEALGLHRKDWCERDGHYWVLVRPSRSRTLKSASSRRPVPLLFPLTKLEQDTIAHILHRYELKAGEGTDQLLLSTLGDLGQGSELVPDDITYYASPALIQVMRQVTGNQHLVFHHTRHSFYNIVAAILFDIETPLAQKLVGDVDKQAIKSIVLGPNNHPTRRASMALARLMGHAHPSTSFKNYHHLMTDWADHLLPLPKEKVHVLNRALHIETWPSYKTPKSPKALTLEVYPTNLQSLTSVLRFVALGKTFEQAAEFLNINKAHVKGLQQLLDTVTESMTIKLKGEQKDVLVAGNTPLFLSYITEKGWARIQSKTDKIKDLSISLSTPIPEKDLPLLVGQYRQILLTEDSHFELIKVLLEQFEISNDSYQIAIKNESAYVGDLIERHELKGDIKPSKNGRIDTMHWYLRNGKLAINSHYAAITLVDRKLCLLRDSYELSLVFLLLGYLQCVHYVV